MPNFTSRTRPQKQRKIKNCTLKWSKCQSRRWASAAAGVSGTGRRQRQSFRCWWALQVLDPPPPLIECVELQVFFSLRLKEHKQAQGLCPCQSGGLCDEEKGAADDGGWGMDESVWGWWCLDQGGLQQ